MANNFPKTWKLLPLEDCMDAIIDYRGKTPRKSSFGIPLITAKIVKGGRVLEPTEFIPFEDYDDRMQRGIPKAGDVVITTEAPLGEVGQLDNRKLSVGQRLITLRGKSNLLDNTYLKFLMMSDFVQNQLRARETGTTVVGIKQKELRKISLVVPSLSEQHAISDVLGSLDDKIELNRRMNHTLEALARALFKSWFVDFDPVRAKMEGRAPADMDAETAALFPSAFDGDVPQGWKVGTINDDFNLTMGQSPPGETYNEAGDGLPFFQGRADFGFRFPSNRVYCTSPTRFALSGDTLVSVRAPVGDINMASEKCAIGRGVAALRHKTSSRSYTYYAMHFLQEDFFKFEAEGTVFGSINKIDFQNLKVVIPSAEVIRAYENICFPLDQQIENNEQQSRTLAALRNALLPRLMNGEIRVKDVEL